ncbi:MAG: hydrogenase maturation nickel metallochaperone HypA [Myxococcales bacterium]|nr:hydrogenase maturation nickel metallochaperone HypA [Myxococcales bacterium]
MHELGLTRGIVAACAERAQGRAVRVVRLKIGSFAGVELQALRFCFELCAEGTLVEGAELAIEEIAGCGECGECGARVSLDSPIAICPCERRARLKVVSGDELMLESMEVDDV